MANQSTVRPPRVPLRVPFRVSTHPRVFLDSGKPLQSDGSFCAPFPACDPSGCGDDQMMAPIDCESCDYSITVLYLVFLCTAMFVIIVVNLLLIVIILRTRDLRKRHGHVKISLAISDLMMGIFVLPSTISNLIRSLILTRPLEGYSNEELLQENTIMSNLFGTFLIISVTTSVYNLFLMSFDRLLAVTYPLKAASGKFFTKQKLWICVAAVWILGILLSSIPAMTSSQFTYSMDPTTFFFVQSPTTNSTMTMTSQRISPYFALIVIGFPYFATILLLFATFITTRRNLKIGDSIDAASKYTKRERKERMKAVLNSYPEMDEYENGRPQRWYLRLSQSIRNGSHRLSRAMTGSLNNSKHSNDSRAGRSAKIGNRIMKMIITMVTVFTVCVCPYFIVVTLGSKGSLQCSTFGIPYLISTCLLVSNSACNFFVYNAWHRSFRIELMKIVYCVRTTASKNIYNIKPIYTSSNNTSSTSRPPRSSSMQEPTSSSVGYSQGVAPSSRAVSYDQTAT